MLLDLTVSFLERILNNGLTEESVAILSSSFLLSKLLPTAIAHLGPIASLQPKVCHYVQYSISKCRMSVV